jgi:hypothetical protein
MEYLCAEQDTVYPSARQGIVYPGDRQGTGIVYLCAGQVMVSLPCL